MMLVIYLTQPFKIDRIQYHNYNFISKDKFIYLDTGEDIIPVNIYIGVDMLQPHKNQITK